MSWFFAFITTILSGLWEGIKGVLNAIIQFFKFSSLFEQLSRYKNEFNVLGWILCVLTIILTYAIIAFLIFLIVIGIRKYVRFRKTLVGNEDMLEEIADLHRDVVKLTTEKERILAYKFDPSGVTYEQLREYFGDKPATETQQEKPAAESTETTEKKEIAVDANAKRFYRLSAVDEKYTFYVPPVYDSSLSLKDLCDDIRNFACSRSKLYYEIKIISEHKG